MCKITKIRTKYISRLRHRRSRLQVQRALKKRSCMPSEKSLHKVDSSDVPDWKFQKKLPLQFQEWTLGSSQLLRQLLCLQSDAKHICIFSKGLVAKNPNFSGPNILLNFCFKGEKRIKIKWLTQDSDNATSFHYDYEQRIGMKSSPFTLYHSKFSCGCKGRESFQKLPNFNTENRKPQP